MQHCAIGKKTITKEYCKKKCKPVLKLGRPEIMVFTLSRTDETNSNPSAPPANLPSPSSPPATVEETKPEEAEPDAKAESLSFSKSSKASASSGKAGAEVKAEVDVGAAVDVIQVKSDGRKLNQFVAAHHVAAAHHAAAHDAAAAAAAGAHLLHHQTEKTLDLNCQDVCVTVPYVLPEFQCEETTEQIEECAAVPDMTCEKQCV